MIDANELEKAGNLPAIIYRLFIASQEALKMHRTLPNPRDEQRAEAEKWRDKALAMFKISVPSSPEPIIKWWREVCPGLTDYDEGVALFILLDALDLALSTTMLEHYRFGEDHLFLGRRWWNSREYKMNSTYLKDFLPPTERLRFHHIRCVTAPFLNVVNGAKLERFRYHIKASRPLNVGLAALSGKARTHFDGSHVMSPGNTPKVQGFFSSHITCSENLPGECCQEYSKELWDIGSEVEKEEVDILALPELCVCQKGREALRNALTGNRLLVIPGSFHEPIFSNLGVSCWENAAPIWTVKNGKVEQLAKTAKVEPYQFPVPSEEKWAASPDASVRLAVEKAHQGGCATLLEHIAPPEQTHLVLSPFGLWAVMICRDAINPLGKKLDAIRFLADHVIVISMSEKGARDFRAFGLFQSRHLLSAVYFVNAAQVLEGTHGEEELHAAWWLPSRNTGTNYPSAQEVRPGWQGPEKGPPNVIKVKKENGFYIFSFTHEQYIQ